MMDWQFMGPGGWLWVLASILFIVGVVVLIAGAIGTIGSRRRGDEAIQTLRARFARGEIDEEQYQKARQVLRPPTPEPSRSRGGALLGAGLLVVGLVLGILALAWFRGSSGMMGMMGMIGMMGPAPTAPAGTSVTLAGSRFTPAIVSIGAGETVRWFNDDAMPHTVTAADRSWDSGNLPPGGSFERPFDAPGTYSYVCLYHSWMVGEIDVAGP